MIKLSNCFLFLTVSFLVLFSPFSSKAQNKTTQYCESGFELRWGYKYVWKYKTNYSTGKLDYVYVYDYVYDCFPKEIGDKTISNEVQKTKGEPWNFSLMAGKYSGEWVAKFNVSNVENHIGTWEITIDKQGKITGFEYDKTSGGKGTITGFVDENSFIKLVVKYSTEVEIKGVFELAEGKLSGKLKQTCVEGICADVDIVLKQK